MNVATFESCFEIDSQGNSSTRVSNEPSGPIAWPPVNEPKITNLLAVH